MKFAWIDSKTPLEAKKNLSKHFQLLEFKTQNITYSSISGHPDIFCCQLDSKLIIAPNLPVFYKEFLFQNKIHFIEGQSPVGAKYPESAFYNAVVNKTCLVHNLKITDQKIIDENSIKESVSVKQGYTRCNLIALKNNIFITSDLGIAHELKTKYKVFYIEPNSIILPGMPYGFLGGAAGICEDRFFLLGRVRYLKEEKELKSLLRSLNYELVELYDGPLFDGGSIIFF